MSHLPLLTQDKQGNWQPALSFVNLNVSTSPVNKDCLENSSFENIEDSKQSKNYTLLDTWLIKANCPTPEAQERFLGTKRDADLLNRYRRKGMVDQCIPYRHQSPEGEWLFYCRGKDKTDKGYIAYIWDIYFQRK